MAEVAAPVTAPAAAAVSAGTGLGEVGIVVAACLVAAAVVMTVTAGIARRVGKVSVVDTTWGLGLVVLTTVAAAAGSLLAVGHPWRRWVLLALVAVWGLRLARHVHARNRGKGEDPRYAEMLAGASFATAVRKVFVVQGLAMWFVALPLQLAAVGVGDWTPLATVGVVVYLVGLGFEAIGDAQLAAYQRTPREQRAPVMDRGLWAWTRHPNYFGDACVWWGIWLVAASAWPDTWWVWVVTALSPAAMTYFLVWGTGARLLERTMMQRPGYPEYAARTSMFVPLPPRRR